MEPILKYVINKYGSDYLNLYDNSNPKDSLNKKFLWIHNDKITKIINPSEYNKYKEEGWVRGRIKNW